MKNLRFLLLFIFVQFVAISFAQINVTPLRITNPSFEARFAGWINNGFYFVTNSSFNEKSGGVYMERWVSQGLKVPDVEIYQNLNNLPTGTYTLSANCQNVQQTDVNLVCSGATFYAGDETVEVNKSATYSFTFTVLQVM